MTEHTEITEHTEKREGKGEMNEKLIYSDESFLINGSCMNVYKNLGNGFLESVYQECVEIEFFKRQIPFMTQKPLEIIYEGRALKQMYKADFVCFDKIIVELKAICKLTSEHRAQVLNYLKATGYELGLLYNFGHYPLMERERIVNLRGYK